MTDLNNSPPMHGLPSVELADALPLEAVPGFTLQLAALLARAAVRMATIPRTVDVVHQPPDDDQLVTQEQAAAFLALPEGYVGTLGRSGALSRVPVGKYVRYRLGDLRRFSRQGTAQVDRPIRVAYPSVRTEQQGAAAVSIRPGSASTGVSRRRRQHS